MKITQKLVNMVNLGNQEFDCNDVKYILHVYNKSVKEIGINRRFINEHISEALVEEGFIYRLFNNQNYFYVKSDKFDELYNQFLQEIEKLENKKAEFNFVEEK